MTPARPPAERAQRRAAWLQIVAGAGAIVAGLALQLAMVAGGIAPGLALSLGGYALLIAGMMLVLVAVLRMARRR